MHQQTPSHVRTNIGLVPPWAWSTTLWGIWRVHQRLTMLPLNCGVLLSNTMSTLSVIAPTPSRATIPPRCTIWVTLRGQYHQCDRPGKSVYSSSAIEFKTSCWGILGVQEHGNVPILGWPLAGKGLAKQRLVVAIQWETVSIGRCWRWWHFGNKWV